MNSCKNCKKWQQGATVYGGKYNNGRQKKYHKANDGWCGIMATHANDWCPNYKESAK